MAQLPPVVEGLTGVDLQELIQRLVGQRREKKGGAESASSPQPGAARPSASASAQARPATPDPTMTTLVRQCWIGCSR